jgi:translation initiation factor 2B subunit (eIF-2B alpha/beta/delta family)
MQVLLSPSAVLADGGALASPGTSLLAAIAAKVRE